MAQAASGRLPLSFEANQGQVDARVRFLARVSGYTLFLTSDKAVFAGRDGLVERMKLIGAKESMRMEPLDPQPGISNYFIGNDPSRWRTNVPSYGRVALRGVYPGIDLIFYGDGRELEYDWVVAPGADPRQIRVKWEGPAHLSKSAGGDLVLSAALVQQKPVVLQAGKRIEGGYVVRGREVSFELARYDATKPLVIDPVLVYSTYLGGNGGSDGLGIALDGSGNTYVTGRTSSTTFPTNKPLQSGNGGVALDAFVTKINAAGSALVYSTYLGGSGNETGNGIAVDSAGNAYVAGTTSSSDFPTANPLQAGPGGQSAFVTKISGTGSALVYSTYLGGGVDFGNAIAVDGAGNAYVTGSTLSIAFPIVNPLQAGIGGGGYPDAFVTKINAAGSAVVYSTYLGGNNVDSGNAIAVDSSGNAYVTGQTFSINFPTANPLQSKCGQCGLIGGNAFVTKINAAGSALVYSTYLGGTGPDVGNGIAVDGAGNAYVTGQSDSGNFPIANALQATRSHTGIGCFFCGAAFVTKINAAGSAFVYSTYLGGTANDAGYGIAADSAGNAYVTGLTSSADFPTANPVQASIKGGTNVFVSEINGAGSALVYSTYAGGSGGGDQGAGIAVDGSGNAYVTGSTMSPDFPLVNPLQGFYAGGQDVFVLSIATLPQTLVPSICDGCVVNGASFAKDANGRGAAVAPGSVVAIFTSPLATLAATFTTASLPSSLSGVSVTFNGIPAPMISVTPGGSSPFVGAQVPFEVLPAGVPPGPPVSVVLTVRGVASAPVQAPIVQSAPGIFTIPPTSNGNGILVFVDPMDNLAKIAAPASASSTIGSPTAPIPRGASGFFYAAGLGAMTPPVADGSGTCIASNGLCRANLTPMVFIGGVAVPVSFAGQADGFPGVYQINITIPQSAPTGDSVPLTMKSSDGSVTSNSATIAVQ